MPPTIILIRHGEALHSLADSYTHEWDIHDPALTEIGFQQCKILASHLKTKYSFPTNETLIVVSPLKRTLQTFQHGLGWLADEGIPVQLRAEWQETTGNPCDVGTDTAIMQREWPALDFSILDPVYPAKIGLYHPSEEALLKRAMFARQWLFHRPEKYVIVVTHSGFIRRVVEGPKYANVESRMYHFAHEQGAPPQYTLTEVSQEQLLQGEKQSPVP